MKKNKNDLPSTPIPKRVRLNKDEKIASKPPKRLDFQPDKICKTIYAICPHTAMWEPKLTKILQ
jgi:hypothetical protein